METSPFVEIETESKKSGELLFQFSSDTIRNYAVGFGALLMVPASYFLICNVTGTKCSFVEAVKALFHGSVKVVIGKELVLMTFLLLVMAALVTLLIQRLLETQRCYDANRNFIDYAIHQIRYVDNLRDEILAEISNLESKSARNCDYLFSLLNRLKTVDYEDWLIGDRTSESVFHFEESDTQDEQTVPTIAAMEEAPLKLKSPLTILKRDEIQQFLDRFPTRTHHKTAGQIDGLQGRLNIDEICTQYLQKHDEALYNSEFLN